MYGSRQLVRTLIDHDLIDELRLTVRPFLFGAGDRLFDELADKTLWRLTKVTALGTSISGLGRSDSGLARSMSIRDASSRHAAVPR